MAADQAKNFAGTCTTYGNRVKIPIVVSETNTSPFYYLTLKDVRNPDYS